MKKPGFYVYGEGSVHHARGRECPYGFPGRWHPMISRETWPSRRRYLWAQIARRLWESAIFRRSIRTYERSGESYFTFGRIGDWLMAQALPETPHFFVEFDPKDSIYDRPIE